MTTTLFSKLILVLLLLLIQTPSNDSANILAITPFPTLSHTIPFVPLFQSLSTQHNLTVITPNPKSIHPKSNVKVIDVSEVYDHEQSTELIEAISGFNIGKHHEVFRVVIQNPFVRELILDENTSFDLVLTDVTSPIWNIFGRRFNCPVVGLLPYDLYLMHMKMGTPTNPAVHSDSTFGLSYDMNTFEKIYNILIGLLLISNDFFYTEQKVDYYLEEYFPKVSSVPDVSYKNLPATQMLFINQIPGFHKLRATPDHTKYIGSGPKYLQKHKTNTDYDHLVTNNIIIVYLELNDEESQLKLFNELQNIPETVLWVKHQKLEPQTSENNIKLIEPYEFQDILHNHKISLLITNGDNHFIELSLQYVIPMLVISRKNGQEMQNVEKLMQDNMAKVIPIDFVENNLQGQVDNLIKNNDEYRKLLANYSQMLSTPLSGLRTATIWLEWLLENRALMNLEAIVSPTSKINYAESWYLDIAVVLFVTAFIGLTILLFLGSKSIELITRTAAKKELVY